MVLIYIRLYIFLYLRVQIQRLSVALAESNQRLAEATQVIAAKNKDFSTRAEDRLRDHETETQSSVLAFREQMDAAASAQIEFARKKSEEMEQVRASCNNIIF